MKIWRFQLLYKTNFSMTPTLHKFKIVVVILSSFFSWQNSTLHIIWPTTYLHGFLWTIIFHTIFYLNEYIWSRNYKTSKRHASSRVTIEHKIQPKLIFFKVKFDKVSIYHQKRGNLYIIYNNKSLLVVDF